MFFNISFYFKYISSLQEFQEVEIGRRRARINPASPQKRHVNAAARHPYDQRLEKNMINNVVVNEVSGIERVIKNLLEKYPVTLPFVIAGLMIGYQTAGACYVARTRGKFQVKVSKSNGLVCMTHDMVDWLRTGKSQAEQSVKPIKKGWKVKTGRPSKRESLNAAAMGKTVRELRSTIAGVKS